MEISYNQKQLDIMAAAVKLFAEKGFDNASVRDVAKAASVNIAMISYYFGSKEKLLEAIFENHLGKIRSRIEVIVAADNVAPYEKIDRIIDTYIDAIRANRHFHLLMIREQGVLNNPVLYEAVKKMKLKNHALIRNAVNAGVREGYFRKNVDITMFAMTLFGTVNQTFSNKKYLCEQYHIPLKDEEEFEKIVIHKLRTHLKTMIKNFLLLKDAEIEKSAKK